MGIAQIFDTHAAGKDLVASGLIPLYVNAPVNGAECEELLDKLFPNDCHPLSGSHLMNQLAEMRRGRRVGLAAKKLADTEISEEIESSAGLAETTCLPLREAILATAEEIGAEGELVRV